MEQCKSKSKRKRRITYKEEKKDKWQEWYGAVDLVDVVEEVAALHQQDVVHVGPRG